jgi:hypothetical protein
MTDTLDLKSRLAKLRLAGVQQDKHVKDKEGWDEIKKEHMVDDSPHPEEIEAAEVRKSVYGKREKPNFMFPSNLERDYDISGHDITSRKYDSTKGVSSKTQGFDHNKRVPPKYTYKGIRTPDGKLVKRKYKPGTSGGKHTDNT